MSTNPSETLWKTRRVETDRGCVVLENPKLGVLTVTMTGYMERVHARVIVAQSNTTLTQPYEQISFQDYSEMSGYDSESRILLTRWCTQHVTDIGAVHILVKSRMVAMGVTTASMALALVGVQLTPYSDRVEFERARGSFLHRRPIAR